MKILILNGPNINMLGIREPHIYGAAAYTDLVNTVSAHAESIGVDCTFFQSNHEGALVDAIQQAYFDKVDALVFNPAAYTHTSVALGDALKAVSIPTAEVHLSDPDTREDFRKTNYVREACLFTVKGKGFAGYCEAVDLLKAHWEANR